MSEIIHGLRTTYNRLGCRCDECREANRRWHQEYRRRPFPHGEPKGYSHHGCRCDLCREAYSLYRADLEARRPRPIQPAEPVRDTSWMERGDCRGMDTEIWFDTERYPAARAICANCPVRQECLDYAVAERIGYGIWGGKSDKERRILRRQRRAAA